MFLGYIKCFHVVQMTGTGRNGLTKEERERVRPPPPKPQYYQHILVVFLVDTVAVVVNIL